MQTIKRERPSATVGFWLKGIFALLLGASMTLGFAPFYLWPLVPILLAIFIALIFKERGKRAFWLGTLFGFGFFAVGLWWVRISLIQFGGSPLPFAILVTLLLALYLSFYYGVLSWLTTRLPGSLGVKFGLYFPLIGVLLEFLRSHLFTGFPWLALGYALTDSPFSPLFTQMGALMSSIWLYLVAGLLFLLAGRGYYYLRQQPGKLSFNPLPGGIFLLLLGSLNGASFILLHESPKTFEKPLKIALLQGNIAQDEKFSHAKFLEGMERYLEMTSDTIDENKIIIWPETAIPDYYDPENEFSQHFHTISALEEANIVTGIFSTEGRQVRNSIVAFGAGKEEDQHYHKQRLLPFGEYIPFRSLLSFFERWVDIPFSDLSPGEKEQAAFRFYNVNAKASASICFEAVFGDEMRYQARQSEFLINVSNDAWFGDSNGPWQHLQIARARAIELARPMVRATNNGVTAFINEKGEVEVKIPQFMTEKLESQLQPTKGITAYVRLGDLSWAGLFAGLWIITLLWNRRY